MKSTFNISSHFDKNKVFLLNKSELEKRLDPNYYRPDLIQYFSTFDSKGYDKLIKYVDLIIDAPHERPDFTDDQNDGVRVIMIEHLKPYGISTENPKFISKKYHSKLKPTQLKKGDLLIARIGVTTGITSIVEDNFVGCNISGNITLVRPKKNVNSKFLLHFINSIFSQRNIKRELSNSARDFLTVGKIKDLKILRISEINKQNIISIMDNAFYQKKQYETQAEKLLSSIDDYLLKELGITLPPPPENTLKNRMFKTYLKEISGGRFDPKLYSTQSKDLLKSLYNSKFIFKTLKLIVVKYCAGDWGFDDKENYNESEFVRCLVIRATEFDNNFNLNVDGSRAKYRLIDRTKYKLLDIKSNDLLIEKSGGSENQPVGRISILTNELISNYSLGFSNFVHKIRVDLNVVNPNYIFNFLKTIHNIKVTDIMQSQTNGIRNLILNEYFSLPIPIPPLTKQKEIADHITAIRREAKKLKGNAQKAFEIANKEIEKILLK